MAVTLLRLWDINLKGYKIVRYSNSCPADLKSLEPVRFSGETLEHALASTEGYDSTNLTLIGLARVSKEIKKIHKSQVPDFFFEQRCWVPRRFIAGGTLLVYKGEKYALAFYFIGHEWFVRPVVLSMKNTPDYYFLVVKKEGSA